MLTALNDVAIAVITTLLLCDSGNGHAHKRDGEREAADDLLSVCYLHSFKSLSFMLYVWFD